MSQPLSPAPAGVDLILYQTEDGRTRLQVRLQGETVWLSLNQLADLFQRDKSVISRHIKNVFEEGELVRGSVVADFATTAADGKTCQGQLVTNCYQLNSRAFCPGQPVTNCNRLKIPPNPRNLIPLL